MTTLMIHYRIKPEQLERHLDLLRAVHDELAGVRPAGVRWESFRLHDGVTFIDLVQTHQPGQFSRLKAWASFRGDLDARCDEPPEITEPEPLATYPAHGVQPPGDVS